MLAIRLQRLGRKGYATYRVVVQDSRSSPTSGKLIAQIGNYNPHSKKVNLVQDQAEFYLKNGAQPSDRVIKLFKDEGIKLPKWVKQPTENKRSIRSPEKLRKNRPAETKVEEGKTAEEGPATDKPADENKPQEPEAAGELATEEAPKEDPSEEPAAEEVSQPADAEKSNEEVEAEESADKEKPASSKEETEKKS